MSPKPLPATTVIATRTARPMANDTDAAAKVPIDLPSIELLGACMPTRPPATTVAEAASTVPSTLLRLKPVSSHSDVHAKRWVELECSRHLAADYVARVLRLALGPLEEELVVDLEDELGLEAGLPERVAAADHRHLDDVRRGALDHHVHRQPLTEHPGLALARAQLGDATDAPEQGRHVAVGDRRGDRLVDPCLHGREAGQVAVDELLRLVLLDAQPAGPTARRQPLDQPVGDPLC